MRNTEIPRLDSGTVLVAKVVGIVYIILELELHESVGSRLKSGGLERLTLKVVLELDNPLIPISSSHEKMEKQFHAKSFSAYVTRAVPTKKVIIDSRGEKMT